MKDLVFLEYAFLFEPDSTWSNIHDFEHDLADFFHSYGYEADVVDSIRGHVGRRVIFITKITDLLEDPNKPWREKEMKQKQEQVKGQIQNKPIKP